MSNCCSGGCSAEKAPIDPKYRRILWIALFGEPVGCRAAVCLP
jgi:hypothetical protein